MVEELTHGRGLGRWETGWKVGGWGFSKGVAHDRGPRTGSLLQDSPVPRPPHPGHCPEKVLVAELSHPHAHLSTCGPQATPPPSPCISRVWACYLPLGAQGPTLGARRLHSALPVCDKLSASVGCVGQQNTPRAHGEGRAMAAGVGRASGQVGGQRARNPGTRPSSAAQCKSAPTACGRAVNGGLQS